MSNYLKYLIIFVSINIIAALASLIFKYFDKKQTQKKAEVIHVDDVRAFEDDKSTNKSQDMQSPNVMYKKSKDIEADLDKPQKEYSHSKNAIEQQWKIIVL